MTYLQGKNNKIKYLRNQIKTLKRRKQAQRGRTGIREDAHTLVSGMSLYYKESENKISECSFKCAVFLFQRADPVDKETVTTSSALGLIWGKTLVQVECYSKGTVPRVVQADTP